MAAGLGFKEFTTGDVLTAADANGYLASQAVMVFASAAARTSAIASPQEGMVSYLKDTDVTQYYSGSAWTSIGGASGGMTSIASGSLSGSALSLTSIAGTYKSLQLVLRAAQCSSAANWTLKVNNDVTATYGRLALSQNLNTFASNAAGNGTSWQLNFATIKASRTTTIIVNIPDYANATATKVFDSIAAYEDATSGENTTVTAVGSFVITAAVTRLDLALSAGTFSAGTYILYGVS